MNTSYKAVFASLMILASVSLVSASPAELTIFPKESSTEINSFTSYEVEVENTGPVKDVYSLSTSNPSTVRVAPKDVELEPGQEETVNVWYNPETNMDEGRYSFSVTATSRANGKSYSTDGFVNVIKDHNVNLEVSQSSRTGCLGQKVTYDVEITNEGIQKESFQLTTRYGQLSQERVTLEEGETREVTLTASSNQPTQRNFNLVAASTTSYAQEITNLNFNAETCYDSEVSITPQQQDVAAQTTAEYEVTVRNTGTKLDEFVLSTSEGELEDTELQVSGESTETTTLRITPEELGQKQVTVTATGQSESSETVTANVVNEMDSEVRFEGSQDRSVCEDGSTTFNAEIENTGAAEETYSVSTSVGQLDQNELTLEPGETEEVNVNVNAATLEEATTYDVAVSSSATSYGEPVRSSTSTLRVENCYDIQMNVVPRVASAGENRSVIYEVQMNNPGTRANTYELSYDGPQWVEIKPRELEVAPGETETAYMYAGIPFEKEGNVKINVTGTGTNVQESQVVDLVIGEDIKDAIRSDRNRVTGAFSSTVADLSRAVGGASSLAKLVGSIIAGLAIVAAILLWEL